MAILYKPITQEWRRASVGLVYHITLEITVMLYTSGPVSFKEGLMLILNKLFVK